MRPRGQQCVLLASRHVDGGITDHLAIEKNAQVLRFVRVSLSFHYQHKHFTDDVTRYHTRLQGVICSGQYMLRAE